MQWHLRRQQALSLGGAHGFEVLGPWLADDERFAMVDA
jgi:hypothetical protein